MSLYESHDGRVSKWVMRMGDGLLLWRSLHFAIIFLLDVLSFYAMFLTELFPSTSTHPFIGWFGVE
jgi:hypothetical protein